MKKIVLFFINFSLFIYYVKHLFLYLQGWEQTYLFLLRKTNLMFTTNYDAICRFLDMCIYAMILVF